MGALARDHEPCASRAASPPVRRVDASARRSRLSTLLPFKETIDSETFAVHRHCATTFGLRHCAGHECRLRGTNTPLRGYTNLGNFCYNYRFMNKGLIYPDECYAIRRTIYEVHNEIGSGFREAMGFVIPFVKIRVRRNIPRAKRAAPAVARRVPHS